MKKPDADYSQLKLYKSIYFSFAEDSVVFQCRYSRVVNVDESMTIDLDVQPEVGRGDLTYSMAITAGALGGTTTVEITPNHNFGEVGARLVGLNKSSC